MKHWFLILVLISCSAYTQIYIWYENISDSQQEMDSLLTILPKTIGEERIPLLNRITEIYWLISRDKTFE